MTSRRRPSLKFGTPSTTGVSGERRPRTPPAPMLRPPRPEAATAPRRAVVEDSLEERRQGEAGGGLSRVGAAHLDVLLQPDLREERGEMQLPVGKRRPLAVEPLPDELAERHAVRRTVLLAAHHEEHRHVEGVLEVVLEPGPVLEDEG